jgi:hypothetical protein
MKPNDKPTRWDHKNALERIEMCRAVLHIHGFTSDGEDAKIKARVSKWLIKNGVKAELVPLVATCVKNAGA